MNTILFIGRTGTAHQYGLMSSHMYDVKIIYVAFSQETVKIWASYGIKPDYVYQDMFKEEYDSCIVTDEILNTIDNDIIEQSCGRFNLNASIQSDRGFALLSYDESLRSAVAHYNVWKRIFSDIHVDFVAHEPCSLFFNHICSILCKKQKGVYSYQISALSDKYEYAYLNANYDSYDFFEIKRLYKIYSNNNNYIDLNRCQDFLKKFREGQEVFLGGVINRKHSLLKLALSALKVELHKRINLKKFNRIYNNIDYWMCINNNPWEKIKNILGYKFNHISFLDSIPVGEKFLFYPIHLEPESTVLYLGDGLYENQIKLIENIAAALPPGYYLYVKDHPHEYAYRAASDYAKLLKIPNVRLINQWIPAKAIISKSVGVVTLNGTAGFEAMLMGKQVYCFGHNMYSFMSRVHYIYNIRDLRKCISDSINTKYETDDDLLPWVMAYLESCHKGYVACYTGGPYLKDFDYEQNAKKLAEDMIKYVKLINDIH